MFRLFDDPIEFDLDSKPDPWDDARVFDLITENEDAFNFDD